VLGHIAGLDRDYPLVTRHRYGAGTAIYVGVAARENLLAALLGDLAGPLGLKPGPVVPPGVMARQIDARHVLYLNLDGAPKRVELKGTSHSLLHDRDFQDGFTLEPFEPEFVELP